MLKKILLSLIAIFLVLQLVRPEKTNPIAASAPPQFPENIQPILQRACYDCHSNETVWPWYSNITPVSFFLTHHVEDARKELNFSEWENYKPKRKKRKFKEIVEQVKETEMPLPSYLLIHTNAKLSDEEMKTLCSWAEEEEKKIIIEEK